MKKLLLLAIVLRVLVAAFLFHPDIKTYNFQASFLKRGVFNIYTYLVENKKTLPLKDDFVYFPLTYFVLGGYQAVVSPVLGSGFDSWLANAGSNSMVKDPNIFKYLVVLKFPYLVLDIMIAFFLKRFFDLPAGEAGDREKSNKAFTLWLFNPFTIFLIYAFSNVDIFAVLLTVVAFLLLKKEKFISASAVLGIAAGFKLYPLLFIPFLFIKGKDLKEKIFILLVPAVILGIIVMPFWSQSFVQSALVSGLTTRIFNPGFSIGFGESMIVGLFSVSILFFYAWLIDKKTNLFNYWVVLLIFIFAFSHFHIAWLLWISPFIVILACRKSSISLPLFLLAALAFMIPVLYDDRSMTISLFRVYSTWYDLISTPFAIVQKFYDPYNLQSVLHSVLAGGALIIGYNLLNKEENE
jgi:hypothetical protein